jgi:hypothetical protein
MNQAPTEHQKLLQHIERLMSEAPDEATRQELQRLRERLCTPEMIDMARDLERGRTRKPGELALEFHDPLLPMMVTATGSVVATATCLFAVVEGFTSPIVSMAGAEVNLWEMAAFAGAFSVMFTALSFMRTFSVRFDTRGMISRVSGARWRRLRVGAMLWESIRSLQERREDQVLEVRAASGDVFEIPMRVVNYPILQKHLENMVRLYGQT